MKKSNIQPKSFYKEAEGMTKGWGSYLRSIDELKDKVDKDIPLTLNEYCWTLYGEGYCSAQWEAFYSYSVKLKLKRKKMLRPCWEGLFREWDKVVYTQLMKQSPYYKKTKN